MFLSSDLNQVFILYENSKTPDCQIKTAPTTLIYRMYTVVFPFSFTLTVSFRAVENNGILVYAADTTAANPLYYMCLYMYDGHLVFSMDTNSELSNKPDSPTQRLTSTETYNDGKFYEVSGVLIQTPYRRLSVMTATFMPSFIHDSLCTL